MLVNSDTTIYNISEIRENKPTVRIISEVVSITFLRSIKFYCVFLTSINDEL